MPRSRDGVVELAPPEPIHDALQAARQVAAVGTRGQTEKVGRGLLRRGGAEVGALQRADQLLAARVGAQRSNRLVQQLAQRLGRRQLGAALATTRVRVRAFVASASGRCRSRSARRTASANSACERASSASGRRSGLGAGASSPSSRSVIRSSQSAPPKAAPVVCEQPVAAIADFEVGVWSPIEVDVLHRLRHRVGIGERDVIPGQARATQPLLGAADGLGR